MSTILYELPDRYVLDTGQVAGKHVRAVRDVLAGLRLDGRLYVDSPDLERFAKDTGQTPVRWSSGEPEDPDEKTRYWRIPPEFADMDIEETLTRLLEEYLGKLDIAENHELCVKYVDRFQTELGLIRARNMGEFVACMFYMVDTFTRNNVVWGVGRGSCVESLVLFLIGVHQIDPVLHEIELEHFFR